MLESIPIPRPLCNINLEQPVDLSDQLSSPLIAAMFAAAKGHRIAAIGNDHSLLCSNDRTDRP
jgi:hypothetical protein